MAKLRSLQPRIGSLTAPVRRLDADYDAGRRARPWRAWYKLARWRKLRLKCLQRDLFTCQMCAKIEGDTSQLVADHKLPHRGDPDLFWDFDNLQCLCKPCHDTHKQRQEAQGGGVGSN